MNSYIIEMIFLGTSGDYNKSIIRETQSCELLSSDGRFMLKNKNLELDSARKTVSAARIKDDTNIMRNIKKREVVNALKGNGKSSSLGGLPNLNSSKKQLELRANFALSDVYEPNFKDSKFVTELMDWHNLLRARHGVKGLSLDTSLCKKAQNWANYLAHTNEFHYQNPKEVKHSLSFFVHIFHNIYFLVSTARTCSCGLCPSCPPPPWLRRCRM